MPIGAEPLSLAWKTTLLVEDARVHLTTAADAAGYLVAHAALISVTTAATLAVVAPLT